MPYPKELLTGARAARTEKTSELPEHMREPFEHSQPRSQITGKVQVLEPGENVRGYGSSDGVAGVLGPEGKEHE